MDRFLSLKLRTQMMIMILLMAIGSMGVILYSAERQREADFREAAHLSLSLATAVHNDQNVLLSGAEQLLSTLSYVEAVRKRDAAEVNRILAGLLKKSPQISNLLMIAPDGTIWASAVPMAKPINAAERRYFKAALQSGRFSSGEYTIGKVLSKPALSFGYPILDENGKVQDVAVAAFTLTNYEKLLDSRNLPRNTSLLLLDHKGTVLFSNKPRELVGKQDRPDLFAAMKKEDLGSFSAKDINGIQKVMAYHQVYLKGESEPYMYVRAGIDKEWVDKKSSLPLMANISAMAAIVLLTALMALYISKRAILDKVRALREGTQKISAGDLTVRVNDNVAGGELGELGAAFDSMAQQLSVDIERRKRAEAEALAKGEELDRYFNNSLDLLCIADTSGCFRRLNPAWETALGFPLDRLVGQNFLEMVHPDDVAATADAVAVLERNGEIRSFTNRFLHADGSYRSIEWHSVRPDGNIIFGAARDVTDKILAEEEKLQLERQLLHMQKLESLGVLAGGIAHDFNNILMAIMGNAELALMRIDKDSPAVDNLQKIEQASTRAADLARQMLAYSGKGRFVVGNTDLNRLLQEMLHMLELSVSKSAIVRLDLHPSLLQIEADATQIRQVVMNLVINASEALGDGRGFISIKTLSLKCDRSYLKKAWLDVDVPEGDYVCLEVTDTGCGMDSATRSKIFDPFFTTKFTGRGLGMAATLGIVRGHRGAIIVESEPNQGSCFRVLFPAAGSAAELSEAPCSQENWRGHGTLLLVDDEEAVRCIASEMLQQLGFDLLTASDGRTAIELFSANPGIGVVLLDLTMPQMDGERCLVELQKIRPDVKVVMSSGYTEYEVTQKLRGKQLAGFIQKPYKLSALVEALRPIA
ncbi:sensor histidine kinase response regulator, HAMP and PAS domain-containing [Citrifermentans bemidjiense Bem]|uniref:histidine kinase n=1 Tax=Citrifermentans bemidjiense (strain ATCC BAA-1014 / DSM 16622 / JCM 12645 / Bem) TaxID=404380 RepID=B5EES0_CITBB|nr:response regulator [Citrifermentans bemidjiense]ACH37816.1 sensor histidine kinase response regulator, HAMP and PAS domain-containing [Citrifermentans bemidjiense Bem]